MIIDWLEVIQQARLTLFKERMDAAATPGKLQIFTAPKPTPGDGITTQTLLANIVLKKPVGSIIGNTFTFFQPEDDIIILNSAIPAWGRFIDGDGFWVADATVGLVNSGAFIQTDRLDWVAGSILRQLSLGYLSENP